MTDDNYQTTLNGEPLRPDLTKTTDLESIDWSFENWNTQEYTHGLHPYPARMIPQIPRALIHYYLNNNTINTNSTIYDPFSGSGTTLIEAQLANINAVSSDINPFACQLSKAKSIPIKPQKIKSFKQSLLQNLKTQLQSINQQQNKYNTENIRDGWFPEPQLQQLLHIRHKIQQYQQQTNNTNTARFFRITLAETCRKVSYQRQGEYKRYRIPEQKRKEHNPSVYQLFTENLQENIKMMQEYNNQITEQTKITVHNTNSKHNKHVENNSIDLVITSPPYGDHPTTVAYGQFSQDPSILAFNNSYDEMKQVDKQGLGGKNVERKEITIDDLISKSDALQATIQQLQQADGRVNDAVNFFIDYYSVIQDVNRVLKQGNPVVWVVGNRTMSRVSIPTHIITRELCESLRMTHFNTLPRSIPSKTLPWENAPENIPGVEGNLMAEENIVIMEATK